MSTVRTVDQTGLKTGQALTILFLLLAFVLNSWIPVLFVGLSQLAGALNLPSAPFKVFYEKVIKANNLVKPNPQPDNPEPHRFSLFVGAAFNLVATLALIAEAATLGWVLVGIVVALANLNFWVNFCLGCWMYYQFNRLGVPGFSQSR
jgi:hypothetical protein